MNDEPDEFESELRAFRPAAVSPELFARIEAGLHAEERRRRAGWIIGVAVAAAAACMLIAIRLEHHVGQGVTLVTRGVPVVHVAAAAPPPTEWAYLQAAMRSPEDLDRLLDRDAARLLPRTPDETAMSLAHD